jgi:hypothetical protein
MKKVYFLLAVFLIAALNAAAQSPSAERKCFSICPNVADITNSVETKMADVPQNHSQPALSAQQNENACKEALTSAAGAAAAEKYIELFKKSGLAAKTLCRFALEGESFKKEVVKDRKTFDYYFSMNDKEKICRLHETPTVVSAIRLAVPTKDEFTWVVFSKIRGDYFIHRLVLNPNNTLFTYNRGTTETYRYFDFLQFESAPGTYLGAAVASDPVKVECPDPVSAR